MSGKVNLFLVLNLGSEMLYVIDQRLRAQSIALDKSAQVLRDLSTVLLDIRFLDQLIATEVKCKKPLSPAQVRLLLADTACCSLMRLDPVSMDKLWDLMVIIFKWQLFVARNDPHRLINITFKHLDGIAKIMPEMKKGILVDMVKMKLLTVWDTCDDEAKLNIATVVCNWLHPFNVKISILMRLGLQDDSCNFIPIDLSNRTHSDLLANIGENIYKKHPKKIAEDDKDDNPTAAPELGLRHEIDELADHLQITPLNQVVPNDVQPCIISILDTLNISGESDSGNDRPAPSSHEFVQIQSSHSREDFNVDPEKVVAEPDLLELMKIQPHVTKY